MKITFKEGTRFTERLQSRLTDDEYRALQQLLTDNPLAGAVVKDCGGVRKVRWADESRGKGKRGGVRVIYYFVAADGDILMLAIYSKGESDDLSAYDRAAIRKYVAKEEEQRKESRAALEEKRSARRK